MFSAVLTTLNTPIIEGGTNSSHTQSSQISKLLRAKVAIKWHKTHDYGKFYAHTP